MVMRKSNRRFFLKKKAFCFGFIIRELSLHKQTKNSGFKSGNFKLISVDLGSRDHPIR